MPVQGPRAVLVVEDFDSDYEAVLEAAGLLPYPVPLDRVTRADLCVEHLRSCQGAGSPFPSLILFDLITPGLDGLEVLRRLRSDADFRLFPIVVLTATSNPAELNSCLQAGANACHTKPIAYLEHRELVASILDYWLRRSWSGVHQELEP